MGITLRQFFHGIEEERESDESRLLREWKMLSREEKDAVLAVMEAFKSMRRGEERECCIGAYQGVDGKKGLDVYELSMQTGISTNAIYDGFKIGAIPSLGNIIKICEAMGISLEYFLGERTRTSRKPKNGV